MSSNIGYIEHAGSRYEASRVVVGHGPGGLTVTASAHIPTHDSAKTFPLQGVLSGAFKRAATRTADVEASRRRDLVAFAKTGAPPALPEPYVSLDLVENENLQNALRLVEQSHSDDVRPVALVAEGNVSDHAWVDHSATYSAVLLKSASMGKSTAMPLLYLDSGGRAERAVPRMHDQAPYRPKEEIEPGRWVDVDPVSISKAARPASLNDFAAECHRDNQHWWHDPATGEKLDRNMGEMLMLVVSEIAECMEGERKCLMDDHLPHRKMAEVELADAVIRVADIAGAKSLDLEHCWATDTNDIPLNKGQALLRMVHCVQAAQVQSHRVMAAKLSRAVRLIECYARKHGYDLWGAVAEKREYNKHRADHKAEARLAAGGKKF